ncbi:MAG: hypothetical protein JNM91_05165, partial [Flavobacteriales bacterium]|nr:hypothetical protein [Flavobacteriales bacterium]
VALKHLKKEDGSKANLEDKLPFQVLEFNGEARRIVLSHTRTFEEGDDMMEAAPAAGPKRSSRKSDGEQGGGQSASVKSVNDKVEKSTLGDLSVLGDLKRSMEAGEGAAVEKKAKRAKKEAVDEAEGAEE